MGHSIENGQKETNLLGGSHDICRSFQLWRGGIAEDSFAVCPG